MENVRTAKVKGDIAWYADVGFRRSEEGRPVGVVAKAGFPSWEAAPPGFGPNQAPFCSARSLEGKGRLEIKGAPWRLLEQMACGPFHVINPEPRVAGRKQLQIRAKQRASWELAAHWLKPKSLGERSRVSLGLAGKAEV